MHARELLELAAVVSAHGCTLVSGDGRVPQASLERYWTASKCRLDRWGRDLKEHTLRAASASGLLRRPLFIRPVLEEILVSEVLTRVWSAVLCAQDRLHGTKEAEPIARSVLIGHLEARHRTLQLLVHGPGIDAEQALSLNRLRRRAERWTDLLIGHLTSHFDVSEFALEPQRAVEFSDELRSHPHWQRGATAWSVVLASLRSAFGDVVHAQTANADLNADIARSVIACFQPEHFDSTGIFRSLWLMRLSAVTDDARGMIAEMFHAEDNPPPVALDVANQGDFLRRRRL